ncbi:MAG: hypothetical protein AAGJ46_07525 [Planctomycetota bacterium]
MRATSRILAILLLATGAAGQLGCRACSACHDYDPPVADCPCAPCGGRSGSVVSPHYAAQAEVGDAETQVATAPQATKTR